VFTDENIQRYVKSLYAVGLLLILVPLVDMVLRGSPMQFGSLQWRFTIVGLLFGQMGTITLGFALTGLAAAVTGQTGRLRAVGYAGLVFAALVLASLALFALDALQMRQLAAANAKRVIFSAAAGASTAAVLGTVALIAIGRGALGASRAGSVTSRRTRPAPSPLVVAGQGAGDGI
jgi:hypothetical protein